MHHREGLNPEVMLLLLASLLTKHPDSSYKNWCANDAHNANLGKQTFGAAVSYDGGHAHAMSSMTQQLGKSLIEEHCLGVLTLFP